MSVTVIHADSREALRLMAEASVDSVVCDPPYALVSIVKRYGSATSAPVRVDDESASNNLKAAYARQARGFMGKTWDTGETAFDPAFWVEVLRVLKPGGHLIAFGGTRTYHRLVCAIEDAGFEIRDQLAWLFGSGFPKSHDVSKGIDKAAGAEREVIRERYTAKRIKPGATVVREGAYGKQDVTFTATDTAPATEEAAQWQGWGTALKPAHEPICLARKPLSGTVAANVLKHGTGALNIDASRIEGAKPDTTRGAGGQNGRYGPIGAQGRIDDDGKGRWPANVIHDGSEEVLRHFPESDGQQGDVKGTEPSSLTNNCYGQFNGRPATQARGDAGSAARFFYTAKADADDRLGSKHPTVKPVDLMAYLVRLVTPPGGLVLDPFAGSGTTGMACMREGFRAILIEREAEYVADIKRRIAHVRGEDAPLFAEVSR